LVSNKTDSGNTQLEEKIPDVNINKVLKDCTELAITEKMVIINKNLMKIF